MKIAKLAVSAPFREKYHGVGSYMLTLAEAIARSSNQTHFARRFITAMLHPDLEQLVGR
jgi:hypothetical protein